MSINTHTHTHIHTHTQVDIAKSLALAHGLDNRTSYTGVPPPSEGAVAARFECLDALQV